MRGSAVVVSRVVVVSRLGAKHVLEMSAADDQQPVETLGADGADEALGVGVCLWRTDRRMDHVDTFAAEDLVEGCTELAVPVMDQEARPLEDAGEAEVAGLLRNPGAGRVGRAAGDMDTTASELDEEEDVVAAQGERLDVEEVTRQDACCLLAQELSPAWPAAPRRGRQSRRQQEPAAVLG
jgi:hypothetical protein